MFLVLPQYIFNTYNCSKTLPHRHQREQNYESRREVARIKSKTNNRKEIFHDLLCSNSRSHLVFIGRDDTRVLGVVELCERARSKFLKAKKAELLHFLRAKRGELLPLNFHIRECDEEKAFGTLCKKRSSTLLAFHRIRSIPV